MKNNKKIIILIVTSIIILFFIIKSFSKYVIKETDTHIQSATEFYFESDIAEVDTGKEYIIKNWNGNEKNIEFNVKNYLNKLLVTNEDITYKISAEVIMQDNINVAITNEQGEEIINNQVITGSQLNINKYNLTISPSNKSDLTYGNTYHVRLKITAISPYAKELISDIKLIYSDIPKYETKLINSENNDYVKLNLKINEAQQVNIKYDNTKLILDKSNYIVNDLNITEIDNISEISIPETKFEKGKNYEIRFIKIQKEAITLGTDIKVE